MTSSMHHDLERGNPLEVRWLSGGVVELGQAKGVPTPLNRAIADILALHAAGRALMSMTPARLPALTLRSVRTVAVEVPLRYVLGTSAATVRAAPLLLVDVETEQGIIGPLVRVLLPAQRRASIAQVLEEAAELVRGESVAPLAIAATLQRRLRCSA